MNLQTTDRRDVLKCAAAAMTAAFALHAGSSHARRSRKSMIYQLRIYEIFEHNKAAFHARFRDHAVRIMKTYGFDFASLWETTTPERTEFVYLLRWPDAETMKASWDRFMADQEWQRIKDETVARDGKMVGVIEDRAMQAVDYAPLI
ncbi:NIPSNAP family protein [Labrys portucalensis]|uniref:NIPSNAP family protein n=2 Tax=Labrys neptuniae TaxID=376174 RepID=A0ABV6Z7Z1_9HYPH